MQKTLVESQFNTPYVRVQPFFVVPLHPCRLPDTGDSRYGGNNSKSRHMFFSRRIFLLNKASTAAVVPTPDELDPVCSWWQYNKCCGTVVQSKLSLGQARIPAIHAWKLLNCTACSCPILESSKNSTKGTSRDCQWEVYIPTGAQVIEEHLVGFDRIRLQQSPLSFSDRRGNRHAKSSTVREGTLPPARTGPPWSSAKDTFLFGCVVRSSCSTRRKIQEFLPLTRRERHVENVNQ